MSRKFIPILMLALVMMSPAKALSESDDIQQMPNCPICGMDRQQFAHSRMVIHYMDGLRFGSCSLHCAALELAYRPGRIPAKIEVGDYASKRLIDAEKAVWVIGGSKMGVMTARAKWAFEDQPAAERFISAHGGEIADFEAAMSAAFADMYSDTKMISEKRKRMKHPKKGSMSHGEAKKE